MHFQYHYLANKHTVKRTGGRKKHSESEEKLIRVEQLGAKVPAILLVLHLVAEFNWQPVADFK